MKINFNVIEKTKTQNIKKIEKKVIEIVNQLIKKQFYDI